MKTYMYTVYTPKSSICDNYNLNYDRFYEKSVKFGGHLEFLYFFKFLAPKIHPTSFLMLYFLLNRPSKHSVRHQNISPTQTITLDMADLSFQSSHFLNIPQNTGNPS